MKKLLIVLSLLVVAGLVIGCGGAEEATADVDKITIGATPVPHAEILEDVVKPLLAEEGIELEIEEFTDYTTPNLALDDGSIDANFFQHTPYLENFSTERELDLVDIASVHIEPIGLYSEQINSLEQLEEGALIAIPNDTTNEGRALLLLEEAGLIELSSEAGLEATPVDIIANPKGLEFRELEAAQLPRSLPDVTAAVINTNYALEADLVPTEDSLIIEGSESPYANVLAVRGAEQDDELLNKLAAALNSQEVKEYIAEEYGGSIVPAF
ncbi:MetQ/NlpA family ABC transporter substrate-binding protein [Natroniella sulfidigena]|uniref:MetQ/NlpA family ABC transporter substrate-binding protein n=1 Tax=Natroniella sulfidigena TaxID=723921 RepID=UPI00200A31E3|nr:MetQ/NlpA family ABC transporter substrate-binding protein [Natroniella sulfidigena]MCK8816078.1 MetQ/NlpA family ABC transporter substrate-binding protein [Natroniella sulfidigena]